ncbi:hypothetical protein [Comamonas aquatilis]|uniref:hypothetical protein n=1 Tax=Comamonas aquatilis TaxID=1778406 RepID=UPI0039F05BA3
MRVKTDGSLRKPSFCILYFSQIGLGLPVINAICFTADFFDSHAKSIWFNATSLSLGVPGAADHGAAHGRPDGRRHGFAPAVCLTAMNEIKTA